MIKMGNAHKSEFFEKNERRHLLLEKYITAFSSPSCLIFKYKGTSVCWLQTNSENASILYVYPLPFAMGSWKWFTGTFSWKSVTIWLYCFYTKPTSLSGWSSIHQSFLWATAHKKKKKKERSLYIKSQVWKNINKQ